MQFVSQASIRVVDPRVSNCPTVVGVEKGPDRLRATQKDSEAFHMVPRSVFPKWRSSTFFILRLLMVAAIAGVVPLLVGVSAAEEVKIDVWPRVAFEPADLRVQVRIGRDDENRSILVTADSENYFTSSETQLDGAESPRVRVIVFRGLPDARAGDAALPSSSRGDDG